MYTHTHTHREICTASFLKRLGQNFSKVQIKKVWLNETCFGNIHFLVACSILSLLSLFLKNLAWTICWLRLQSWTRSSSFPHLWLLPTIAEQQVTAPSAVLKQELLHWNNPRAIFRQFLCISGGFFCCCCFRFLNPVWWLAQLHRTKPAQLRKCLVIAMGQE